MVGTMHDTRLGDAMPDAAMVNYVIIQWLMVQWLMIQWRMVQWLNGAMVEWSNVRAAGAGI